MTYIDRLATEIRKRVPDEVLPEGDTDLLFRLYAVLLLAKGTDVSTSDVHNAWTVWMQSTQPEHPSLKPFDELDADTQAADQPYADAIRSASRAHTLDLNR